MLRIPTSADTPPPLLARPTPDIHQELAGDGVRKSSNKRRRSKKGSGGEHSWENLPKPTRLRRGEKKKTGWVLAGVGLLFLSIVAGVFVSMFGGSPPAASEVGNVAVPVDPIVEPNPEAAMPVVQRSDVAILNDAEPMARTFLQATTVDEILPLVRNPGVAEARMREFYPGGKIEAVGLSKFNAGSGLLAGERIFSIPVLTRDQEVKSLAFVETPQGLKIDWESWVGWSEIPWEEFLSAKPVTGHVFRVVVSPVDYYNFDFSDDRKWKSYRFESPDKEHAIYGYVERETALSRQVHLDADKKDVLMTLSLKFPTNTRSNSQVEIERFVCEGWVEEGEAP